MADVEKLLELYEELKQQKSQIASHFQDIAAVMLPRRGGFAGASEPEGNRLYDEILDSTPQEAARALASAIGVMTRPEGKKWFFIRADDPALNEDDEAVEWFDEVEDRMVRIAFENPSSRFRQAMAEADLDLVTFGTNCVFTGQTRNLRGMMYQSQHLKDIFIMTDENNQIDGLIRRRFLNVRQASGLFGFERAGKAIREADDSRRKNDKVEFIHVVIPRDERRAGPLSTNMPYASVWIEISRKEQISESGFQEFPFVCARFDTTSGEDWGRGPGMVALSHSNMLQAMDETIIISGQKKVEPPILVPDDGTFNAGNTFPGGITYYDAELAREMGRIPIEAMDTRGDIGLGLEMQQDRREQVRNVFFRHVMNLPVDGPEMTATEVIKRDQEFLRELGGLFGRMESDYIAPIVERTFNVMLRAGAFPPIPDILLGADVSFEYESPLKKVREQMEAAAARQWKDDLLLLAQSGKPEALDRLNADNYVSFQAEANGVPLSLINNDEEVAQIREARAQQAQQQAALLALREGASAGADVGRAVQSLVTAGGAG